MLERVVYKTEAKRILRQNYFRIFKVSFIVALIAFSFISLEVRTQTIMDSFGNLFDNFIYYLKAFSLFNFQISLSTFNRLTIIGFAWSLLVGSIIQKGYLYYLKRNLNQKAESRDIFRFFNSDNYGQAIWVELSTGIITTLYYLMLIIPGVIKSYQYYFVNYLYIDYPNMSAGDLRALSREMTEGLKFDLFVLDLSFILWAILVGITAPFTLGLSNVAFKMYTDQTSLLVYEHIKSEFEFEEDDYQWIDE